MSVRPEDHDPAADAATRGPTRAATKPYPPYVQEALGRLSRAQRRYVIDGCIHGDVTDATIRALQRNALFYLKITSPNGRAGFLELTPLGVTVQAILKARSRDGAGHSTASTADAGQASGTNP